MYTVTVLICFAMLGCFQAGNTAPPVQYDTKAACIERGEEIAGLIRALPMVEGLEQISKEITCTLSHEDEGKKSTI